MSGSGGGGSVQGPRVLNAVPLENAVLCAECDVVSDSPHDLCLVCGSHSLFNIARVFGGKLPRETSSVGCPGSGRDTIARSRRAFPQTPPAPKEGNACVTLSCGRPFRR